MWDEANNNNKQKKQVGPKKLGNSMQYFLLINKLSIFSPFLIEISQYKKKQMNS
jgi:hypothetical protein